LTAHFAGHNQVQYICSKNVCLNIKFTCMLHKQKFACFEKITHHIIYIQYHWCTCHIFLENRNSYIARSYTLKAIISILTETRELPFQKLSTKSTISWFK